jgi:hypothetical protein
MNMNDRRGIVSVADIFDKNGEFKRDKDDNEIGMDMLIRKVTGYISYVRGENPYTFPFRVYPNLFSPENTFKSTNEYPKCQINGKRIPDERKIQKLHLYLTAIGSYQSLGYTYIVDRLRSRQSVNKQMRTGKMRKMPSFKSLAAFGYTDLMTPIEALNIIYPLDDGELEELTKNIENFDCVNDVEEEINDLTPIKALEESDEIDEIDEVLLVGPKKERRTTIIPSKSELESEPAVTEGIDADMDLFDEVIEIDTSNINSNKKMMK